ncbi:MAG: transposase [Proteobacteria bacterium]|nr:MAG: transposase [Pseudomonadota bacterium]
MDCGGGEVTARVIGLDTPETVKARCDAELAAGKRATERLRALVARGEVVIRRRGYDKYGRDLIRLTVDGRDVADTLVSEQLAVRYRGGARPNWCERLAQ